jgi:hypothetical protein
VIWQNARIGLLARAFAAARSTPGALVVATDRIRAHRHFMHTLAAILGLPAVGLVGVALAVVSA